MFIEIKKYQRYYTIKRALEKEEFEILGLHNYPVGQLPTFTWQRKGVAIIYPKTSFFYIQYI
jgi:hypothetical protein